MARITEIKKICIHQGNICNGIGLRWLNSMSGWDMWVFEHNQLVGLSTNSPKFFKPTYTSLKVAKAITQTLYKEGNEVIDLFASNISINNWLGFQDLYISPVVYEIDTEGNEYIVDVVPKSFTAYETRNNQFSIELKIKRQDLFSQII